MARLNVLVILFEQIITQKIVSAIKSYISLFQHGFLKERLTGTNLLKFTSHICKTFTAFSKMFDLVNQKLLMFKLQTFGFPLYLLKSY